MEVKNPGIRGGRYYRTKSGKIRYGVEPQARRKEGDGPVTLGVPGPTGPVFIPGRRRRGVIEVPEHAARRAAKATSGEVQPADPEQVAAAAGILSSDGPAETVGKLTALIERAWAGIRKALRREDFDRPPVPVVNGAKTAEELVADAKAVAPTLLAIGKEVARSVGGKADAGPGDQFVVKSLASIQSKLRRKSCRIQDIGDGVRMTIHHDTPDGLMRAYRRFLRAAERSGIRIVDVDNKWDAQLGDGSIGYGGVHVDVALRAPSGRMVRGEVQFHLTPFYRIKEEMHRYYERFREGEMDQDTYQRSSLMIAGRAWLPYLKATAGKVVRKALVWLSGWWR